MDPTDDRANLAGKISGQSSRPIRLGENEKLSKPSFHSMNGGLMAMILLSLLRVGLLQTVPSVRHGYWFSRSHEFLGQGLMQTLRWMRIPGDTLFAIGAIGFVIFVFGLGFGYSLKKKTESPAEAAEQSALRAIGSR